MCRRSTIPLVYEVKRVSGATIVINGGIGDLAQCQAHLQHVDGIMLGRAAYQNPELLLLADTLYGEAAQTLDAVLPRIRALIAERLARGEVLRITPATCSAFSPACAAPKYTAVF